MNQGCTRSNEFILRSQGCPDALKSLLRLFLRDVEQRWKQIWGIKVVPTRSRSRRYLYCMRELSPRVRYSRRVGAIKVAIG
jgi:hypothetical protein